jgi:hypothetical protein
LHCPVHAESWPQECSKPERASGAVRPAAVVMLAVDTFYLGHGVMTHRPDVHGTRPTAYPAIRDRGPLDLSSCSLGSSTSNSKAANAAAPQRQHIWHAAPLPTSSGHPLSSNFNSRAVSSSPRPAALGLIAPRTPGCEIPAERTLKPSAGRVWVVRAQIGVSTGGRDARCRARRAVSRRRPTSRGERRSAEHARPPRF